MVTKKVLVSIEVDVVIDESKFDKDFMREFKKSMYDFSNIEDHIKHLATLKATGCIGDFGSFIEGYGPHLDMGISFSHRSVVDCEIVE